ncbi:hypothetical protein FHS77_003250 [Paenochrobactrum gallinarii]|uniref:Uncharacterized protein n=1 Tax=Paenochrobactrum gallinarii TaxID=643673 RepID=A0A841M969_9HYPH|nr:hypothetical protein [Paenochrobactrum gallinarii]MBB6262668.1 hypothetical protein [Paenochrobactrum gallinarii]
MSSRMTIGRIYLHKNSVPLRDSFYSSKITFAYFFTGQAIMRAKNKAIARQTARNSMLKLSLLREGEEIISILEEEFCLNKTKTERAYPSDYLPITRDSLEHSLKYEASRASVDNKSFLELTQEVIGDANYNFDLLHYDEKHKKILWLHLAYGIAELPQLAAEWSQQSFAAATKLAAFATQYYDNKIEKVELICVDPFLECSHSDQMIWSLNDINKLTGRAGTASKIAAARSQNRKYLYKSLLNRKNADMAAEVQKMTDEMRDIIYAAQEKPIAPKIYLMTPASIEAGNDASD